jgi:pectate lyase
MKLFRGLLILSLGVLGFACGSGSTEPGTAPGGAGSPASAGSGASNAAGAGYSAGASSGGSSSAGAGYVAGASGATVNGGASGATVNGGAGGTTVNGGASSGGTSTGGNAAGGMSAAGAGGAVTPYVPAWACLNPTWPTATGTPVSISATKTIAKNTVYDGKMALHNGSGSGDFAKDCSGAGTAAQGTTKPLFELEDGATIQNVIVGNHGADGIHCQGTCTIKNVWFPYVCDDMVTAASDSSGTVTIDGGGGKNAHDKLFQDNSHGKFIVQNFYGEKLGKMYRACGAGGACGSTKGNVTFTNITAVGVDQIAGVTQGRDSATFSKVCTYQTPTICDQYDSSDNAVTDGPDGTTCKYKWTDIQVMLNRAAGTFATASECPNYLTSGSTTNPATACIADLPSCVKGCAPGVNGLKMCDCTGPGNTYKCHACAGPATEPAKSGLAVAKAQAATACASSVTKNKSCSPEWDICSSGTQYCACVFKPGTLQTAPTVWDCVNQWW